jgi:tetratricopeptide (TPR) repeat protein
VAYDIERSGNSYRRAIELLEREGTQSKELALTYVNLMNTDIWNADNEKALADHDQAMKIAAKLKIPRVTSGALAYRTCVMGAKDADKADEMCRKAIAAAREHGSPLEASNAYFVRAVEHALTKGPSHRTERMFLDGIEYASKVDFFLAKIFLKAELIFEVYLARGELSRARELAEECFASVGQLPRHSLPGLVAISTLGQVLLLQGELAESRELLSEVESATRGFGVLQLDVPLYMALARVSFEMGDSRELAYLAEGRRLAKKRGLTVFNARPFVQILSQTAEFLFARNELDSARANSILAEISKAAREIDEEWPSAYANRVESICSALRGDWDKAIDCLKRGSSLWKELGWDYESAKATYQVGLYHQKVSEFKAAEKACEQAMDAFRKMGAKKDAETAESSMNALIELAAQRKKAWAPKLVGAGQMVFDYLAGAFVSDYVLKRYPIDRAGWRTFGEVARATGLPKSLFYPGPRNSVLKTLEASKTIEARVFSGERGRGGEVTRTRVGYELDSRMRDYMNRRIKNESGAL